MFTLPNNKIPSVRQLLQTSLLATSLWLSGAATSSAATAYEYAKLTGPKKHLLADTATFYEIESCKINIRHLIEFKANASNGTLTITNWIPRNIKQLNVIRRSEGKEIPVCTLDLIPGLESITVPVSTEDLANNPEFDFVPTDDLQREIKKINIDWNLAFGDRYMHNPSYREANVQWRPVHPQDARYLLTFMIHAAQAVSHPKFEELWMKTPFNFSENGKVKKPVATEYRLTEAEFRTYPADEQKLYDLKTLKEGHYYNKAHRKEILAKYKNKFINLGVTGGGGLGGGSAIGINHSKFIPLAWSFSPVAAKVLDDGGVCLPEGESGEIYKTPWIIFGHECGHALGFGHNSSYCVLNKYSHITIGSIVQSWLTREKKTLITADTMIGRDPKWEGKYVKSGSGSKLTRPLSSTAFEWAGPYGRHNYVFPRKTKPEWNEYLQAQKAGKGFEFIKKLPINVMIAKLEGKMTESNWKTFQHAWHNDQGMECLQAFEQGKPFTPTGTNTAEDEDAPSKEDASADGEATDGEATAATPKKGKNKKHKG